MFKYSLQRKRTGNTIFCLTERCKKLDNYYVVTFHSVSQALRFEKLALSQGIAIKLIPVPRVLSSSCGIAARFTEGMFQAVTGQVAVEWEALFSFSRQGNKLLAERLPGPWERMQD
ncbi:MAG: hypothetical protein DDT30_00911 [Dehalococcoidia bacterium]|nr:hypothetical protein [Bacillota bacterium]